ncbi:MAG: MerR family DNA-binding transcriptional regulator [Actinomycetota bacterium]|nr:MerR family DNA-binding transcriptional regulator [Actinomycetota bacterium]
MGTYHISELADRVGIPATTLRFYERVGLLPRSARAPEMVT